MEVVKFFWKYKWVYKTVPKVKDETWMWVCIICNIFVAGSGTLLGCYFIEDQDDLMNTLIVGVCQFLSGFFVVGYVWSWLWAYLMYYRPKKLGILRAVI